MARGGFYRVMSRAGSRRGRLGLILGGAGVIAACITVRYFWGAGSASADTPRRGLLGVLAGSSAPSTKEGRDEEQASPSAASPAKTAASSADAAKPIPDIVAAVNGRPITREELARDCLRHHGKEVLEALVNKHLIREECQRRSITVTRKEVDAEIERMAKRFNMPVDQWLKLLKEERKITSEQYANDIIWPTLALRRLAGEKLTVTQEELVKAFETDYGPAIRARMITSVNADKARRLQAAAAANPDDFGNLAKSQSEDTPSASVKGIIQPIRKHGVYREIEQAAFSMADGEVSKVIPAGGQYVILKREGLIPARSIKLEQISPQLEEVIRDRKMRSVAAEVFGDLQKRAVVENVFNDPKKSQQMPGVAAVINGAQISVRQLAEECIQRHGRDVLEGTISRKLVEQACKQHNVTVSDKDIDAEIAQTALLTGHRLSDGSPDVKAWLDLVAKRQGISAEVYRNDIVWPALALKKLVGEKIDVTEDDVKKGFDSNYGPRVRCRAIVLSDLRRAQEVWKLAREKPTVERFGDLAAQHSIEGSSRALRGEVPPIRKYGGQPMLEQEAFALRPGEVSGVIQLEDKYVILFCEGQTQPAQIELAQVRDLILEDIREKKQRLAMSEYYDHLQDSATIDNFVAGNSKAPVKSAAGKSGKTPQVADRPAAPRK